MKKTIFFKALMGATVIAAVLWAMLFTEIRNYIFTSVGRHTAAAALKSWLDALGWWGPVIFVLIYGIGCLFLLPATLFTGLGCLLFGKFISIPMNLLGSMLGAGLAFLGSRYLFRDTAEHLVGQRLAAWNDRMRQNGVWVVMWMRLCFLPFPVVNLGAALSKITFKDFMIGTFLSTILPLAYFSYTLGSVSEMALEQRSWLEFFRQDAWIIVFGALFYLSLPKLFKWVTKFKD